MKSLLLSISLLLIISLNGFSQSSSSFQDMLCDSIFSMANRDMESYAAPYFNLFGGSTTTYDYSRESAAISFNAEEYDEMMAHYSQEGDGIRSNITRKKTYSLFKEVVKAFEDSEIREDLFDCFLYRMSLWKGESRFEAEYEINVVDDQLKITKRTFTYTLEE